MVITFLSCMNVDVMPQHFHTLRCLNCNVFQVHQVTKSKNWMCKLCGQKQFNRRVYFEGSGADCRKHVQNANILRANVENKAQKRSVPTQIRPVRQKKETSKWEKFASCNYHLTDDQNISLLQHAKRKKYDKLQSIEKGKSFEMEKKSTETVQLTCIQTEVPGANGKVSEMKSDRPKETIHFEFKSEVK